MSITHKLRSVLFGFFASERLLNTRRRMHELGRRLRGTKHRVSAFIELDDPYSYLLCHYLPELEAHYDIELKLYLTEAVVCDFRPAPELYPEYALTDCRRLARELGVPFLDKGHLPPVEHRRALLDALAGRESTADFKVEVLQAISAYWRGDAVAVAARAEEVPAGVSAAPMLRRNRRLLLKLGHYNTAMLHYGGEWYWGVDRLHYLTGRLDSLGAAKEPGLAPRIASILRVMQVDRLVRPPATAPMLPPLEVFFSFRSPYSYLALERMRDISHAFAVELVLRPVLPMVIRGMPLPYPKMRYVAFDAAREARHRALPFGRFADPVGSGVERCLAVFELARAEGKALEFSINAGRAVWADGSDLSSDSGLRRVTEKSGLDWTQVRTALNRQKWRATVEENRLAMTTAGCWGVPSLRVGDWISWGQDRDWLVARHLEDLCDSGDGILEVGPALR